MKPFKMALPRTVNEAVESCGKDFESTQLLAGGTDLLAEIKDHTAAPETVVNLKGVSGLRGIQRTDQGLEIGALTTLTEMTESEEIRKGWPALVTTIERTATPNVRNAASIGGNLCQRPRCWYYRNEHYDCLKKGGEKCFAQQGENEFHAVFDNFVCAAVHPSNTAPVFIAYGATLEIVGPKGKRTLSVEDFFISPTENVKRENVLAADEVVTRIMLPKASENAACAYVETREKQSFDWATCGSTVLLEMSGKKVKESRIVLNAVAPVPVRRKDLERKIRGQELSDTLIAEVCKESTAGARTLEQNAHKLALIKATLRRAFRAAMQG